MSKAALLPCRANVTRVTSEFASRCCLRQRKSGRYPSRRTDARNYQRMDRLLALARTLPNKR